MIRFSVTREFFIPENADKIEDKESGIVVYLYAFDDKPAAMGFGGKRQRPDFHLTFDSSQARLAYIEKHLEGWRRIARDKAKRRAEQKAFKTSLKVGDILVESWGYEQTNVNWYQVVEAKPSGKTVVIREIATGKSEDTGFMCGYCWPKKDAFMSKPITKRVRKGDILTMTSYSSAFKWDGERKFWSSYY